MGLTTLLGLPVLYQNKMISSVGARKSVMHLAALVLTDASTKIKLKFRSLGTKRDCFSPSLRLNYVYVSGTIHFSCSDTAHRRLVYADETGATCPFTTKTCYLRMCSCTGKLGMRHGDLSPRLGQLP